MSTTTYPIKYVLKSLFNANTDSLATFPKTKEQEAANWAKIQRFMQNFVEQDVKVTTTPGGTGLASYGGLVLTNVSTITTTANDLTFYVVPFDSTSAASSNVTLTTGASAKITVSNSGDYFISFTGTAYSDSGTTPPNSLLYESRLHVNGSTTSPFIGAASGVSTFMYGNTSNPQLFVSWGAIVTLTAGDYVQPRVSIQSGLGNTGYVVAPSTITAVTPAGLAFKMENAQFNVLQLA